MKDTENIYPFFALMARMKYIERWALMRNSTKENISEHSLEVAMIAHGLGVIGNERFGREYDVNRLALMGLYHDVTEIITGDMPTPIKYYDEDIKNAYKRVENIAGYTLLHKLPANMQPYYESILVAKEEEKEYWKLVKAADKMSALIKCMEEESAGNSEFQTAKESIQGILAQMDLPEVQVFMEEFLPAYSMTLDELQNNW